jgi:hypothetical protein
MRGEEDGEGVEMRGSLGGRGMGGSGREEGGVGGSRRGAWGQLGEGGGLR